MGINHRCFDILVTESLLHRANVVAILQAMRRKAVTESMAGDSFLYLSQVYRLPHGSLSACFMAMMSSCDTTARLLRQPIRRKDVLPKPLAIGMRLLAF